MRIKNPFSDLTKFELILWLLSVVVVALSFLFSGAGDYLTLIASLIGVTALIFVAKGYVLGQVLTVVFALFYGIVSFYFQYYGEMLTYMCMTAPIAVMATISWIRNPYKDTKEVKVKKMHRGEVGVMLILTVIVTIIFYFVLRALGTANLIFSTISVTTSFLACYLTYMRSPYYALAYAANDIVLIILWILASCEDLSYVPMVFCFVMFFANDMYGFINWSRMEKRQKVDNVEIYVKKFIELTTEELYDIFKVRVDVFVVEQKCPYPEIDCIDKEAYHVFIKENNAIVAYLRVFEKEGVRIGRVLSVKRRLGFGTQVMKEGIRVAQEKYNAAKILIEAQVYAKEMYEKLGFVQTSQEFVEDGIPHIKMELNL